MIPKIIHYCWFGRGEKPKLAIKCINSWKKYCPDYRIIEWNEDNYDISAAPLYVRQAYDAKKWAFVTDYVRYQVIYENGGIYLDVDVELIKNLDPFLRDPGFFGFEFWRQMHIASGLGFGAVQGLYILRELMQIYQSIVFLAPDGSVNDMTNVQKDEGVFLRHGLRLDGTEQYLDGNIHIYPTEYFAPLEYLTGKMNKTKNTASIHWYGFSWGTKAQKRKFKHDQNNYRIHAPFRLVKKLIGRDRYEKLAKLLHRRK